MALFNTNFKSLELSNNVIIEDFGSQKTEMNDLDSSVVFRGGLYLYKIGIHDSSNNKGLNSWLSYVLYAGLLKFRFKKTRFKINLGLNLRDYYQNIRYYLSVKRQKKLSYVSDEKEISKILEIIGIEIYPNIYASAVALSKVIQDRKFIVLKFGLEDFEGIYFDPTLEKEKQTYILGEGLSDHVEELQYAGPEKVKDYIINKNNLAIDAKLKKQVAQYFKNQIERKINRIVGSNVDISIVLITEEGISSYIGNVLLNNIKIGNVLEIVNQANTIASEGLYLIDNFETIDSYNEKVGVAIANNKTNFTSRKNRFTQD